MNDIIDAAGVDEIWWIDDDYHFKFNGKSYELMENFVVLEYCTKKELKKASRQILKDGVY